MGDMTATDTVVADSLVLPLVGMSDHIEGRLAFVKTELKLSVPQMLLWDSFAAAMRSNAARENEMIARESSDFTRMERLPIAPKAARAREAPDRAR